jgi:hypothetical protein
LKFRRDSANDVAAGFAEAVGHSVRMEQVGGAVPLAGMQHPYGESLVHCS